MSDSDTPQELHPTDEDESDDGGVAFDHDLPTRHEYLGKMNNVRGYTLFDEGKSIKMLGIYTNTLVLPGFTLPLVINSIYEQNMVGAYLEKMNTFVLLYSNQSSTRFFDYGVTMEVFEMHTEQGTIHIKARGRQRCRIISGQETEQRSRWYKVTVTILPEIEFTSPLSNTQLLSLQRHRSVVVKEYEYDLLKNYKYRRYHLSQYPLADWIYDSNELCFYKEQVLIGLSNIYTKEILPKDPVALSFWFLQHFQLSHEERLKVLKLNSAWERLRLEWHFLKMGDRVICCGSCKVFIAKQSDVFPMSKDGLQNNYCNPGGEVYETLTVSDAENYTFRGKSLKEFSWFPGYGWTIMTCRYCGGSLGWLFTSEQLQPDKFYGLANSCCDIKIYP